MGAQDLSSQIIEFLRSYISKRLDCPLGSPDYCEDYKAPNYKLDVFQSTTSNLGYDDQDQIYNWCYWYIQYMTDSEYWGTTANVLHWDLGSSSYHVLSMEIRPNLEDADISFKCCDDAPW